MNELQQIIYDKIRDWTLFAHGVGTAKVSPHYYYAWLLRENAADQAAIKRELRAMVDAGLILAKAVKYNAPAAEIAYNTGSPTSTQAVILALPQTDIDKITKARK